MLGDEHIEIEHKSMQTPKISTSVHQLSIQVRQKSYQCENLVSADFGGCGFISIKNSPSVMFATFWLVHRLYHITRSPTCVKKRKV